MSESIQSVVVGYILNKSVALREKPIALIEQAKVWMRPLLPERHGEKRQSVATLRPRQLLIAAGSSASLAGATIGERLRPKAPQFDCDWNERERVVNVATSLPYFLVGAEMVRKTKGNWQKAYAWSQVAVGLVAATYHASKGKHRQSWRRLDFWTIAFGSAAMTRALYPKCPTAVTVLSTVATPFIPFTTSAANTLAMESLFLRRAISNDKLRGPHLAHCSAAGAGLALFALDEFRPHLPCVHAGWHILSSLAVRETLPLIQTSEQPSERCRQGFATAVWNKSGCLSSSLKV